MYNSQLKQNLNKIDSLLKKHFENVKIDKPKIDDKNYIFKINISSPKSNPNNNIELIMEVSSTSINLMDNNLKWGYKVNPNDDNSNLIVRNSSINFICNDISDIILNERFDKDYINEYKIKLINESGGCENDDENDDEDNNEDTIDDLDRNWEFNIDDEVMVRNDRYEGSEGIVKERVIFKHGNFDNNTYIVDVGGEFKKFFEYDVFKK